MGRLGKIFSSFIAKLSGTGANAQFVEVEEFAGDIRKAQVFGPCNEDFAPPYSANTINSPLGRDRGFLVSHSYTNQAITPVATYGERRLYSTNADGDVLKSEMFMHDDGLVYTANDNVSETLDPDGTRIVENQTITETLEPDGTRTIENPLITEVMEWYGTYTLENPLIWEEWSVLGNYYLDNPLISETWLVTGTRNINNPFVEEEINIDGSRTVNNLLITQKMGEDGTYKLTIVEAAEAVPPLPPYPAEGGATQITIEAKADGTLNITTTGTTTLTCENLAIISDTMTHNDVNVGYDHVHGGVAPGTSTTDGPQ